MQEIFEAIGSALAAGETVVLVTIVRANGSTPQRVGAKMLVYEDGRTLGTIGGGCYEHDAFQKARAAFRTGAPQLVRYDLNDAMAEENGLICGGQMDVFIEPLAARPDLYVIGAGHVGIQLAKLAAAAGFRVHVADDREKFANVERFPDAAEIVVDDLPSWLSTAAIPRGAYAVIVTRGHRHDADALRALAGRELTYLGLIGSRAKIARIFDLLRDDGVPADALRAVHAPIGLDIGAVTPEEIAIAIAAEIIAVRRGRLSGPGGRVASMAWAPAADADPALAGRAR